MTVQFKNIPANWRLPLFQFEVDNSQANTGTINQRTLIMGQILTGGAITANMPQISLGVDDAKLQGGQGSNLALMTQAARAADGAGEMWYLPLADDPAAVAATGAITFTGPATANGTLALYIGAFEIPGGIQGLVNIGISAAMTASQIATTVAAAINMVNDLPVTAAVDGGNAAKVDLTAKNKGLSGNDIDIRFNYQGAINGEALPAGVGATITAMVGGTTNPSLTAGLTNLTDQPFDFIICPYTDATSLNALKSFLNDVNGRWSYQYQIFGHVFYANRGTAGAQTTFGVTRNNQHETCLGFYDSPTPNFLVAADIGATASVSLRADPALPLQTLALSSMLAPPQASRFPGTLRNSLLFTGISTFTVADDGTVAIENLITTYQQNSFGQPDNSYLQVETMFTTMAVLRYMKTRITTKYARVKLADNGTRVPPGSNIVTPNMVRSELISAFIDLGKLGLVDPDTLDDFIAGLIVERNAQNRSRLDVLFDPTFLSGLRVFAMLLQFHL